MEDLIAPVLVAAAILGPLAGTVAAGMSIWQAIESARASRNFKSIIANKFKFAGDNNSKALKENVEELLVLINQTEELGPEKVLDLLKTNEHSVKIGFSSLQDKDQKIVAGFLAQNSNVSKRLYLQSALLD
jgi:hypothetical protein